MLNPNTTCSNCGKPIYAAPNRLARGDRPTCSVTCKWELFRRSKPTRVCEVCGKPLERQKRFCSQECSAIGRTFRVKEQEVVCENCGKVFVRDPARYKKDAKHVFCSHQCSGQFRSKRVNGTCTLCGEPVERTQAQVRKSRHGLMFCCKAHALIYYAESLNGIQPNGLEMDFLAEFPQLHYTGDGKLWVQDDQGWMCPDFRFPQTNKVIELWGDYWHQGEDPTGRIQRLANAGYEAIVIWESEFYNHPDTVRQRVTDFLLDAPRLVSEPSP